MARGWDLHSFRGLALAGISAGMTLGVGSVAWELWRRGLDLTVGTPGAMAGPRPAPAVLEVDPRVLADLRSRALVFPVAGITPASLTDTFTDPRGAGTRLHRAVDILAPYRTPVRAVDDGTVAKLYRSASGGISVYHFDPDERYCYYYAHLAGYAPGLAEGARVRRGQVLGYVGTTGNAPRSTPHLHFAIFRLSDAKQWWTGTPVNPYSVFR